MKKTKSKVSEPDESRQEDGAKHSHLTLNQITQVLGADLKFWLEYRSMRAFLLHIFSCFEIRVLDSGFR